MKKKTIIIFIISISLITIFVAGFFFFWKAIHYSSQPNIYATIDSFTDCEESGFPLSRSHPEICTLPNGTAFTNDQLPEKFTYFPIEVEDLVSPPSMYGLWPYGVKGNNKDAHNEGHPGWDFELVEGSKIFAVADGYVNQIHNGSKGTKVIEFNAVLAGGNYHVTYHSVKKIAEGVEEGSDIKAGQVLAEVGYPLGKGSFMIHFGVFPPGDSVGSCPTDFFEDYVKMDIDILVRNSINDKTGDQYESACVGGIDKEIWEQNYPDSIKNLGGNENWE